MEPENQNTEEKALLSTPPPVWKWCRVYCFAMAGLYFVCFGLGISMLLFRGFFANGMKEDQVAVAVMGAIYAVLGLVCLLAFGAAPFLPRKKWVWVYDLVLICLGMTSICCMPACIPLLIFWIRPEVKTFFGMEG